jgi:hypothetical protein
LNARTLYRSKRVDLILPAARIPAGGHIHFPQVGISTTAVTQGHGRVVVVQRGDCFWPEAAQGDALMAARKRETDQDRGAGFQGLIDNGTVSGISEPTRANLPPTTVPMLSTGRLAGDVGRPQ